MMQYIISYTISEPNDPWKIKEHSWRQGSSEEELETWAKDNNITSYIISLPMYEVKHLRDTIDGFSRSMESLERTMHNLKGNAQYEK